MSVWRQGPGNCIICGAPHTACTKEGFVAATPALDAARARAAQARLPAGPFTTGTYRRTHIDSARADVTAPPSHTRPEQGGETSSTVAATSQEPSPATFQEPRPFGDIATRPIVRKRRRR